jgi:hypothetical protein
LGCITPPIVALRAKVRESKFARVLAQKVPAFRRDILLPEFQYLIAYVAFEEYADILDAANDPDARELADFLRERIRQIVG